MSTAAGEAPEIVHEQSALALGRTLVWGLTRLRVETLVVSGWGQAPGAPAVGAEATLGGP